MKRLFGSECGVETRTIFHPYADELKGKADKALEILESGLEVAAAVLALSE